MMQECPRCKFLQPEDRYCANCGLDIEAYVPQPESLFKKLIHNTKLHIVLVVTIVCALGFVVYLSQRERLSQEMESATHKVTDYRIAKSEPVEEVHGNAAPQSAATPESISSLSNDIVTAGAGHAATSLEVHAENATELTFTFTEVPKALLQQLMAEGQTLSEGAQSHSFTHALISDIATLRERDPDFRILPGSQTVKIKQGVPFSLDFTHDDQTGEQALGLNLDGMPHKTKLKSLELELDGQLRLKSVSAQTISSQDIHANFTFASVNTLILVLMLPRQGINDDQTEPFANTPLAIFESPQFTSSSSELAIFIQAK